MISIAYECRGGKLVVRRRIPWWALVAAAVVSFALGFAAREGMHGKEWDEAAARNFERGLVAAFAMQTVAGAAPYSMSYIPGDGSINLQVVPRFRPRLDSLWVATEDNPDLEMAEEDMRQMAAAYAMREEMRR